MKPHLFKANGQWICSSVRRDVVHLGRGWTARAAYFDWAWAV